MIQLLLFRYHVVFEFPLPLTNNWLPKTACDLNLNQHSWLLSEGSLTAKLKSSFIDFSVEVLSEKKQRLTPEQASFMRPNQQGVYTFREVILRCDNQAQIYAQSWIPEALFFADSQLMQLGNKPLGEYLFGHPDLIRNEIQVAHFDESHPVIDLACSLNLPKQACLGRRSIFSLFGYQVMVCEVFLPQSVLYT